MTLKRWLEDARVPLVARADQIGWQRTVERDLQRAMEKTRPASSQAVVLEHWPGVGAVDLLVQRRVAVELKWCKSSDGLCNSAWDIAKLATALAERQVEQAWIAAGAPVAHWKRRADGVELFEPTDYSGDALIRGYESWWRFWCKDVVTRPTQLPEEFAVSRTLVNDRENSPVAIVRIPHPRRGG